MLQTEHQLKIVFHVSYDPLRNKKLLSPTPHQIWFCVLLPLGLLFTSTCKRFLLISIFTQDFLSTDATESCTKYIWSWPHHFQKAGLYPNWQQHLPHVVVVFYILFIRTWTWGVCLGLGMRIEEKKMGIIGNYPGCALFIKYMTVPLWCNMCDVPLRSME